MRPAEEISQGSPDHHLLGPEVELVGVVDGPVSFEVDTHRVAARSLSLGHHVTLLVVADAIVAGAGIVIAISLRFGRNPEMINGVSYLTLVPLYLVGWILVMCLGGSYDKRILVSGLEEFRRVLNGAVWMLAAVAVLGLATHVAASRGVIAMALVSTTILTLGARFGARRGMQSRLRGEATLHRAVVVGSRGEAASLANHMERNSHVGFTVTAVHTPRRSALTTGERIAEILLIARETGADTIAMAGSSGFDSTQLRRLAWRLEGTGVRLLVIPSLTDLAGPRITVHAVGGLPLLHIELPEFCGSKRALKRGMDILGGALLILILMPFLLVIAGAVWLSSGRPVLFSQTRVGRGGRHFKMFKFRTMVPNSDPLVEYPADSGPTTPVRPKPERDPRVTPLGGFLRRYSLDELPQFFNVLAGSMSLVGPRPHRPFEVADYGDDVRRRLLIKPGVTGLWQVSGRAALPWTEAVRLDLHYVENWSVSMDLVLMLKTLKAVATCQGAY